MQRRLDIGLPTTRYPNSGLGNTSGSDPLNGATLTVTRSAAAPFINNNVTVTATLLDSSGNPLEGYAVTISITGVTTATSNGTTNASGQTTYTYQSAQAGTDNASAVSEGITSNTAVITWSINFLLNDQFTDTDPAPITLPRTATPTGTETGLDSGSILSVGSGRLNIAGSTTSFYLFDAQRARAAGLTQMTSGTMTGGTGALWFIAWNNVNNAVPTRVGFRTVSGQWRIYVSGTAFSWNAGTITQNVSETVAAVLFTGRNEYYRLTASGWQLVWVDYSNSDANLYAGVGRNSSAGQDTFMDNLRVANLGAAVSSRFAQLVGNITAGTTSAARNGNALIAFDLDTLPSAGSIEVKFRIQDANNYWIASYTSGLLATLGEVVGGVLQPLRGSAAVTTGKARIIADGTTIAMYDDDAQLFTYGSASNFQNATGITISSLGTGGAISDMDIYDRYATGIADANLDACAAG